MGRPRQGLLLGVLTLAAASAAPPALSALKPPLTPAGKFDVRALTAAHHDPAIYVRLALPSAPWQPVSAGQGSDSAEFTVPGDACKPDLTVSSASIAPAGHLHIGRRVSRQLVHTLRSRARRAGIPVEIHNRRLALIDADGHRLAVEPALTVLLTRPEHAGAGIGLTAVLDAVVAGRRHVERPFGLVIQEVLGHGGSCQRHNAALGLTAARGVLADVQLVAG